MDNKVKADVFVQLSSLFLNGLVGHNEDMFDIYCPHCKSRYLLSTADIISTHRTSNGPIAYVHCPHGHHLVREFRTNRTQAIETWSTELQRAS